MSASGRASVRASRAAALAALVVTSALTLLVPSRVAGAPSASYSSRLVYGRGKGAEQCPDESAFRRAVAARVGYDPFFPWAEITVTADVRRDGGKLVGRVTVVDGQGLVVGTRDIASHDDCAEIVSAMALVASLALEGWAAGRKFPSEGARDGGAAAADGDASGTADSSMSSSPPLIDPAPQPPELPASSPSRPPPSPAGAPATKGLAFFSAAGGLVAIGSAPSTTAGVALGVGAGRSFWTAAAELRLDSIATRVSGESAPAASRTSGVRAQFASFSLLPCAHQGVLFACASLAMDVLRASGYGVSAAHSESAVYLAGGARLGFQVPLPIFGILRAKGESDENRDVDHEKREPLARAFPFALRVYGDMAFPFESPHLRVAGIDVWTAPPLYASAGVSLVVRWP